MAVTKSTVTNILTTTTLGASASVTSNSLDVSTAIDANIEIVVSCTSPPTTGTLDIYVYDSLDGTNFSTQANYVVYISVTTTSYRYTLPVSVTAFKYIQVQAVNNTDVSLDVTINAITISI